MLKRCFKQPLLLRPMLLLLGGLMRWLKWLLKILCSNSLTTQKWLQVKSLV